METKPHQYRPEDPRVGDLIFQSDTWTLDLSKPELIAEKAGVVTSRIAPNFRGPLMNYRIGIKLANGTEIQGESRDWKCLHQLRAMIKTFSIAQKELVAKLEAMAPKKDPEIGME